MNRLAYDLHLHSCLSPCGDDEMTPANMVGMAKVIGLDLIALTDHNSAKNCPAFVAAAKNYGMQVLCGMELCTQEEVHVVCLFPSLEDALSFDAYVYEHIPDIPNKPALFGNQILYDENDQVIGTEPKLLISATDIPFSAVYDLTRQFHGIMIPAHIDKTANGLLGQLGFIPPDARFSCFEVKDKSMLDVLRQQHPYLQHCNCIFNSDAHDFNSLNEPIHFLDCADLTNRSIFAALTKSQE